MTALLFCPQCRSLLPSAAVSSQGIVCCAHCQARVDLSALHAERDSFSAVPLPSEQAVGLSAGREEKLHPLSLERVPWARLDVLPARPRTFLLFLGGVVAGSWLVGLFLAPDWRGFVTAPEWQVQPVFLATHLLVVRLFVTCYARNYLAGAAHLHLPEGQAQRYVRGLLGLRGGLLALFLALPLSLYDFLVYLPSAAHRQEVEVYGGVPYQLVDLYLAGIWSLEWALNAYIWVVIVGFLLMTLGTLRRYPFRAEVEVLLHEKHYRPFLLMSAQGALVVLLFTLVNGFYVWYASGDWSDYIGLGVTVLLLLVGFGPPWLVLKSKIGRALRQELCRLRRQLVGAVQQLAPAADLAGRGATAEQVAARLDHILVLLRTLYLEHLQQEMGKAEAKALLVRLLAPISTIGWKLVRSLILPG